MPYDRHARHAGRSKFGFNKLVDLAIDAVTAQSTQPLRFVTMFGIIMSTVSALMFIYYIGISFLDGNSIPSGFTTIVLLLVFLIGFNALVLGLLGEYIGRIFNNTRNLPMTIIEHVVDNEDDGTSIDGEAKG